MKLVQLKDWYGKTCYLNPNQVAGIWETKDGDKMRCLVSVIGANQPWHVAGSLLEVAKKLGGT